VIGPSSLAVFALFAAGAYLMLSSNLQRLILGFILLSNGANLLVLTAAGLPEGAAPPLLAGTQIRPLADPLAQAFLLTAIVIGLGLSGFLVAITARTRRETGSDDLSQGRDA
jgi:multicomponent Na+:H+ antiporter subunit C